MKPDLKALTEKTARLPSLPGVAVQIVQLATSRDADVQEVAKVLSLDPALATKMLRFVNSPVYAKQHEIENLRRAVVIMGLNATINLALSFSLLTSMRNQQGRSLDYAQFWRRSLLAATAARELGEVIGELALEELFLTALLQDIGMLALDKVDPTFYAELGDDQVISDQVCAYEKQRADMDHAELGSWLLKKWNLAERTQVGVGASHDLKALPRSHGLARFARCVALSGPVADLFIIEDSHSMYSQLAADAKSELGIERSQLDEILLKVSTMIPELEALFDLKMAGCELPAEILEQANEALMLRNLETLRTSDSQQDTGETLAQKAQVLDERSRNDALTGVFSRRFFENYLEELVQRTLRSGKGFSLAVAAVDNLEEINKMFGRASGDQALKDVARLLEGSLRAGDVIARYGGEVFAVLLPGAPAEQARAVCERIVALRESLPKRAKGERNVVVSLSMGVVTHCEDFGFESAEEIIEAANSALYSAKMAGRNRVVPFSRQMASGAKR